MKKILGLDLGTNSIGWALINVSQNDDGEESFENIAISGSRIIPMDQASIGDFNRGNTISQTKERTQHRGTRRLYERGHLRRERMNRVLSILNFLPEHYKICLDEYGKIKPDLEPKIAWKLNSCQHYEFLFMKSYNEMLQDFKKCHQTLLESGKNIPYDWTIYYLRKKALSLPVSKYELAWILLNFNQKRGYYQLRGEDVSENTQKAEEYYSLKVVDLIETGEKKGKDLWYNVVLENGFIYRRTFPEKPDWIGKVKDFIVTTDLEKDGKPKVDKEGNIKRSFRMPKEDDWGLLKKKTEADIDKTNKTIGEYIYDALLAEFECKVRGKLVGVVERKYYKAELARILEAQKKFIPELNDIGLYERCITALYPNNTAYRNSIASRDFTYLFVNDILFYQRPLKSKKYLINDCPMESRHYIDKGTGECVTIPLKCIAKSNPLFQEFRLWQFITNLRIYERERKIDDSIKENIDVTSQFLPNYTSYSKLYDWLNNKQSINQKTFLCYPEFGLPQSARDTYRWNYVEEKDYPCNETRSLMLKYLSKAGVPSEFLTSNTERELWHILYSVEDKIEIAKALSSFAKRHFLGDAFVEVFRRIPSFKKDYGAYSEKAIKKLLPLMRMGQYWKEDSIDSNTHERINMILTGEYDERIRNRVREKSIGLKDIHDFQGLPVWLANYIVYDRHSEAKSIVKWSGPDDIDVYLNSFKQHSLRNPIVESVILETLRTVRDIWKAEGQIDEIHIELGRELKNSADKRKRISNQILENENTNLRIKAMLQEFLNPEYGIENVRPNSPSQQDLLRIYEEAVLDNTDVPDDIQQILGKFSKLDDAKRPTPSEMLKYKAWLEQKYRSPYTGAIIPLGKLFSPEYEIEHIIPRAVYFDDSFSNKVICESEVNKLKDNMLGYSFIKKHQGEIVTLNGGKTVKILSVEAYEKFVQDNYSGKKSIAKKRNLLSENIPEKFIQRQLNDSRYISKVIKTLLSNVVRVEGEQEDISKNVITCTGSVTDRLKKDWGINKIWDEIIMPRFKRMNDVMQTNGFVAVNANGKEVPTVPISYQRGFNKKRIDHRHHAMDAIVIACATRNIISYLNNESACKGARISRYDLQRLLCDKVHDGCKRDYNWVIRMPSNTFVKEVKSSLRDIIVSFKQNIRVINKSSNKYEVIKDGKKIKVAQVKGDNWAIRKSLHKDTVYGEVNLRRQKNVSINEALKNPSCIVDKVIKNEVLSDLNKGYNLKEIKYNLTRSHPDISSMAVYYYTGDSKDRFFAVRTTLDESFTKEVIESSITDSGIQHILLKHLESNDNKPTIAFSPDGIDKMNANIVDLNNGMYHKPIRKVRKYEKADKFAIGESGCKSKKFVEADKGTNLFFAIYQSEGKRTFATIPLIDVIMREKNGEHPVPDVNANGDKLLFYLSPNDLVYVPTADEIESGHINDVIDKDRIYKMVSSSGRQCFFVSETMAVSIVDKKEFSPLNKMERALSGEMIKDICIPIKVDRLGRITNIIDSIK